MIKNGAIALLIAGLVMTIDEYAAVTSPIMFWCLAAVIFAVVCAIECECERISRIRHTSRALRRQISAIKITPSPTKAK